LDRIQEAVRLDAEFAKPDGFDVLDFIARSFASIPRAYAVEVLLHTDIETAQSHPIGRFGYLEPTPEGVILRTRTDTIEWCAGLLAALPCDFEVRRPGELNDAIRAVAARLLRCASGSGGD